MSDSIGTRAPSPRLVFALLAFLAVAPAFYHDLWNPDEPRVAHLARAMLDEGGWIVPRVNGEPFVEQPPLQAWLVAGSMAIFGAGRDHDWVPRLPSMLFSLALLALVYRLGVRYWGARVGLIAVVFLATTVEFFVGYQRAIVDTSLAFFVAVAMVQLLEFAVAADDELPMWRFALLGVFSGLSFLSKNLIGIAFIGLVALAIGLRDRRRFLARRTVSGVLISIGAAMVVVAPWMILFWRERPDLLHELLVRNTIGRFTSSGLHDPPLASFLHRALVALSPWVLVAAPHFWARARGLRRAGNGEARAGEVLLWWAILPLALVLSSGSKREIYLLPVTPAVALAAAVWIESRLSRAPVRIASSALGLVLFVALPVAGLVGGAWSGTLGALFWAGLVAHLAIAYRWLRGARRFAGEAPAWALSLLLLTGLAGGGMLGFQIKNHHESYRDLMAHIDGFVERGYEVIAYKLPLRDISAIPYYLGRRVENLESPDSVRARFGSDAPVLVVFRASVGDELLPKLERVRDAGEFVVRRAIRLIANQ